MTARQWLQKAKDEHFAIGAFNVGNIETFKAIAQAAAAKRAPVIIESSPGETKWMGVKNVSDLAHNFSHEYGIPVLVNLDHSETFDDCREGMEAGYGLIHFDGSKLPLEENLQIAQKVVDLAHGMGATVEVEIDHIQGSSEVHQGSADAEVAKSTFSDPERSKKFMDESGADILTAFFGNVHGVFTGGGENLHIDVLQNLVAAMPEKFFSLHGGSGIPDAQVKAAVEAGIQKVNINTEIRQMFRQTLEEELRKYQGEYAMYKILPPVVEAVQKLVEHKIEVFGSANKLLSS